ncbi:MAG: uroporphyrinogen-III C-methyltransferase, partial [Betaproteobacteria bacterium]
QRELGEYRDLIRIRVVDAPDAMLLGQPQQVLVRQQLRLRLLSARQALLARNDRLYRADLAEAQTLVNRYFDGRQRDTAAALASMKQLASAPLSVETPNINDSVSAVRAVRTAPGR